MSGLSGILAEIADAAGLDVALKLARDFGGTDISLSDAKGSVLSGAVGQAAAAKIVQRLGRGKVTVPMANLRGQKGRRAAAAALLAKGASARQVALATDMHTRSAFRVKAATKKPKGDLFD
ncbi:MAG: hypothetical protein ACK41C_10360 [Phenylobacterium sp.]|uniref:hypothetical protein n=1 Tax=Phenylobacterium sp. TaxID=1871053 RepID=UPI00391CA933